MSAPRWEKLLVCGGREYAHFPSVYSLLSKLQTATGFSVLVHGACGDVELKRYGADQLAAKWAGGRVVEVRAYPANWAKHKRAAGPIRNRQMLTEETPDRVLAFAGGPGTADMKRAARAASVLVLTAAQSEGVSNGR